MPRGRTGAIMTDVDLEEVITLLLAVQKPMAPAAD